MKSEGELRTELFAHGRNTRNRITQPQHSRPRPRTPTATHRTAFRVKKPQFRAETFGCPSHDIGTWTKTSENYRTMAELLLAALEDLEISPALQLDTEENVEDAPNPFAAALGATLPGLRAAMQAEERERRAAEHRAAEEEEAARLEAVARLRRDAAAERERRAAARTAQENMQRRAAAERNGVLANDAAQPVRDPQPESGIDAALGDAFTSQGRSTSKPWLSLRGRDLSILEPGNAIFKEEPGIVNLITVSPPASSRRAARA